jgi:hypothetical protein
MSLYLDQKYLSLISNRLPMFKRKGDHLYNCRCILCGDSTKKRNKARGYFFNYKNELRYKCHNCDASLTFGNFLKNLDGNLFSQYRLEKYADGFNKANTKPVLVFEEPKFKTRDEKLIDQILDRLDTLPEDNEAVLFCKKRNIPIEKFNRLYYVDNIKNIVQLNDKYKESVKGEEPRLILPFFDEDGQLTGVTCRALRGEALRYITIKIKEDVSYIFGIDQVDKNKPVFVVEGPIDSLFVNNSIAVAGSTFSKINTLGIDKQNLILVFDNQPRNKEVCKLIEKNIEQDYNVVIWPQHIEEKDINEMVIAGRNIQKILKENTVKGLTAKAKFIAWKRC